MCERARRRGARREPAELVRHPVLARRAVVDREIGDDEVGRARGDRAGLAAPALAAAVASEQLRTVRETGGRGDQRRDAPPRRRRSHARRLLLELARGRRVLERARFLEPACERGRAQLVELGEHVGLELGAQRGRLRPEEPRNRELARGDLLARERERELGRDVAWRRRCGYFTWRDFA